MNDLTIIENLIEERIAALYQAVKQQEKKVTRLEAIYKGTTGARPREIRRAGQQLDKARLDLERLRGRLEEANKTWTLINAHTGD